MKKYWLLPLLILTLTVGKGQIIDPNFKPKLKGLPQIRFMKVLPDDKVIISGDLSSVDDIAVNRIVRLEADGSLDQEFTHNVSKISKGFSQVFEAVYDQESHKIYVAGYFEEYNDLLRLNYDGTIDETFNPSLDLENVYGMGVQSNGKIIALSSTFNNQITRLNQDGTTDNEFNTLNGPDSYGVYESELKILSNDEIIISGLFTEFNGSPINNMVKLDANGNIDESFDFSNAFGDNYAYVNNIQEVSNGDLIISGSFEFIYGQTAKSIARINSDGSRDIDFVLPGPGANIFANEVTATLDSDENILVAGIEIGYQEYSIIKLDNNGALNNSYSQKKANFHPSKGTIYAPVISINSSGDILFSSLHTHFDNHYSQGLSKLNASGEVYIDFNADISGGITIYSSKVLTDGSIVISGQFTAIEDTPADFLLKLNSDGSPDYTFINNIEFSSLDSWVETIEEDNSGNVLLGGGFSSFNNVNSGSLVRMSASGVLDNTYNAQILSNNLGQGVNDIIVLSNDKILIAGGIDNPNLPDKSSIIRLNGDGTIDNSFEFSLSENHYLNDIDLLPDGKIIYSGLIPADNKGLFGKINSDGSLDDTFSVTYDFTNIPINEIESVTETGMILVSTYQYDDNVAKLLQFEPTGTLNDDISVQTNGYDINVIYPLDAENVLLGGQFQEMNNAKVDGFVKISLVGGVDSEYSYEFEAIGNLSATTIRGIIELQNGNYLVHGGFSSIEGEGAYGIAKMNFDVPKAPNNLSASFDFSQGVSITWNDQTDRETGYQISKRTVGVEFVILDTIPANNTNYVDNQVSLNTKYEYRVRALKESLYSGSAEVEITTGNLNSPLDLTAQFDFLNGVVVNWNNNNENFDQIEIYKSTDNSTFTILSTMNGVNTQHIDPIVELNTTYYYKLKSIKGLFRSDFSTTLEFTTPTTSNLIAPQLTLTEVGVGRLLLSWETSDTNIFGFEIYRSLKSDSEFQLVTSTEESLYIDENLNQGDTYFYKVRSFDLFDFSEYSNVESLLVTSNERSSFNEELSIYPNPSNGLVKIKIEPTGSDSYQILNSEGKIIQKGTLNTNSINTSQLTSGVYIIKIINGKSIATERLIINN
ncbi:T9SS type A sorting domain-containing protein [Fulvivirga sp.]|uniref:T9SS type A sorting domain-containing protein n=1 Tax=Fulvivirga sp. TaxID=1931237 RepID=UPI0032EE6966